MSRLLRLNANRMAKLLELAGFECIRSRGSHFQYRHQDGRSTTIPFHGSELLPISIIKQILAETQLTEQEYRLLSESI